MYAWRSSLLICIFNSIPDGYEASSAARVDLMLQALIFLAKNAMLKVRCEKVKNLPLDADIQRNADDLKSYEVIKRQERESSYLRTRSQVEPAVVKKIRLIPPDKSKMQTSSQRDGEI